MKRVVKCELRSSRFLINFRILLVLLLLFTNSITGSNKIRFAFLTDIHVAPGALSEKNFGDIIEEIKSSDLNFVILTGDLTNSGTNSELEAVKKALDRLNIPIYVISGNHETNWSESACATFSKLWGEDRFVFEYGPYLFVGFATGPYLKMGDGQVKSEDLEWLQKTLEEKNAKGKLVIAASHYPLAEGLANWFEVTDILKSYGVKVSLCGHGHQLSAYNFDGILGIMGRATVKNGSDLSGYNIVELDGNKLTVFEKELGQQEKYFLSADIKEDASIRTLLSEMNVKDGIRNMNGGEFGLNRPDFSINKKYNHPVIKEIKTSTSILCGVSAMDHLLFYSTSTGKLIALDTRDNLPLWEHYLGGTIYSSPICHKGIVLQGCIDGKLYAFNCKTGKEQWSLDLKKPIIGEPLIESGFLYLAAGNEMNKIDIKQGKIVWTNQQIKGQIQGCPTINKNNIVFGAWDTYLYCLNKNTGEEQWKWTNGHKGVLLSPANITPAISNGIVYIVAPDRYMTAIDLKNGETLWRTNKHMVRESMGISEDGGSIYAKLMNDSLVAVEALADSCKTLWVVDAGFGYEHNPCPVVEHKGIVYAGGKNGLLVAIDKNEQKVKWKYKAGTSAVNRIIVDPKKGLWVSLIEGKIIYIPENKE